MPLSRRRTWRNYSTLITQQQLTEKAAWLDRRQDRWPHRAKSRKSSRRAKNKPGQAQGQADEQAPGEADDEQALGGTDVEQAPGETDVEQAWASMGSMQHCWWLGSVDAVRPPWRYYERFGAPCPSSSCGWPISQVDGAAYGGRAFSASTAQAPASQAHMISDFAGALDLG